VTAAADSRTRTDAPDDGCTRTAAPLLQAVDIRRTRTSVDRRFVAHLPALTLQPGDRVALTGPSGCGKSSLLEALALAAAPDPGGTLMLTGPQDDAAVDLQTLWSLGNDRALTRLRATRFGYVQQTGGLFDFLTVDQSVAMTQRLAGRPDAAWRAHLLAALGLGDFADRPAARLSAGQRQRVSLARALAHRPAILIADEPTAALDQDSAEAVLTLLIEQADAARTSLILSSHDRTLLRRHGVHMYAPDPSTSTNTYSLFAPVDKGVHP